MIILTDWPKIKWIDANYRGMESDDLVAKGKKLFHLMMPSGREYAGGYDVRYDFKGIEKELAFRKDTRLQEYLHPIESTSTTISLDKS